MKCLRCAALCGRAGPMALPRSTLSLSLASTLSLSLAYARASFTTSAPPHTGRSHTVCSACRLVLLVCVVLAPAAATGAVGARRALHAYGALAPGPSGATPLAGHAAAPAAAVAGADADAARAQAGPEAGKPLFDYRDMGAALAHLILLQARALRGAAHETAAQRPCALRSALLPRGPSVRRCAQRRCPVPLCMVLHPGTSAVWGAAALKLLLQPAGQVHSGGSESPGQDMRSCSATHVGGHEGKGRLSGLRIAATHAARQAALRGC